MTMINAFTNETTDKATFQKNSENGPKFFTFHITDSYGDSFVININDTQSRPLKEAYTYAAREAYRECLAKLREKYPTLNAWHNIDHWSWCAA